MKHKRAKIRIDRVIIFIIGVLIVSYICFMILKTLFKGVSNLVFNNDMYIASDTLQVSLYDMNYNEIDKINRGIKVTILKDKIINNDQEYYKINYQNVDYYVLANNLTKEEKDVVLEKEMYVRTSLTLYENLDSIKIKGLIKKGSKIEILDYDFLNEDGSVNMYKVKYNDDEGYVYGKYLVNDEEAALANYEG